MSSANALPTSDDTPPPLIVRWLRPQTASAYLDLPTAPITLSTQKEIPWQAFTAEESAACEAAWQALSNVERKRSEGLDVGGGEEGGEDGQNVRSNDKVVDEDTVGVSIARDKLFEVDVKRMQLRPIYWKINAPPISVHRATWMYDEHKPMTREHAIKLEILYQDTKPWQDAYNIELTTALSLGMDAHEKLKLSLDDQYFIIFENADKARLIPKVVSKSIFSSIIPISSSTSSLVSCYPNSIVVYRGYDAAVDAYEAASRPTVVYKDEAPVSPSGDSDDVTADDIKVSPKKEEARVRNADANTSATRKRGRPEDWSRSSTPVGNEDDGEVTDLILIIHGIGQGLATQYEGFNFVYAVNMFRQITRKQSTMPALASIMRNRRVQFLPVQWRMSLKLDEDEEQRREESGLTNDISMSDITIKQSLTYVRELVNNVLIDIPYFMSHHRQRMIESVVSQANRIYRLWCARNPGFDRHGRVHMIAHSLGSSLATYILSNQPTIQPSLGDMSAEYIKGCKENFLFNTSSLFMAGSPVPVFFHINRSQLIARKGRERTMKSPADEALDKVGLFGCLSVDTIYNVFYANDPVAYLLNPCVDAKKAKDLPPSPIRNTTAPLFTSFSTRMTRMFDGFPYPFSRGSPRSASPAGSVDAQRRDSGFELGGQTEVLLGSREERRFAALNPHGTLDFSLPSEGAISEYVDMITAHSAYWSDPNFASFILAEIFARKEDLVRTGLGVERSPRSVAIVHT